MRSGSESSKEELDCPDLNDINQEVARVLALPWDDRQGAFRLYKKSDASRAQIQLIDLIACHANDFEIHWQAI